MSQVEVAGLRNRLRQLLRVARFEGWSLDDLEDEIDELFRGGVTTLPPPPADQRLGPP